MKTIKYTYRKKAYVLIDDNSKGVLCDIARKFYWLNFYIRCDDDTTVIIENEESNGTQAKKM